MHEEPGRQLGRVRRAPRRPSRGRTTRTTTSSSRARDEVDRGARTTAFSGSASGSHGKHFTSTFTSHPAHASSASASVGTYGQRGAELGERLLDSRPSRFDRGVVVDDQDAVGGAAHVELDPVGTELAAPARRPSTVFSGPGGWRPDGRGRAVAIGMRLAAYEHPKDATCSTFDA